MTKSRIGNYIHTGGFNRLAGRSSAPGSQRPEVYFWRWRVLFVLFWGTFLFVGLLYLIF